jgi:hypothetical protein
VLSALFFFRLFFVPVSLAAAEVSAAVESAEAFFLDFDFLLLVVEVELSSDAAASFLVFLVFFFFVVLVSVLWSLELACGLASAGIDKASNRQSAAVHVASFTGSRLIWVLIYEGRWNRPGSSNSEACH